MRFFSILLAVAGLAACGLPPTDGDESPSLAPVESTTQAIRNGTRDPQMLPLNDGQVLALGWLHPLGDPSANFCTGTLIAPNIVATARHCIDGRSSRNLSFGIGLLPRDPRASFRVANAIAHPNVDAAILVLAEDAVVRVPELEPIAFNRAAPWDGLIGSEVEAGGYGETYDRSRSGRYFAVVLLEGIDATFVNVNGRGQQGICFGDSGGPVMTVNPAGEIVILGVESSGDSSCWGRDRLTRLDAIADWIDGIINGDPPEDMCGDIDFLGECDGQVARWCQNGAVEERDCGSRGQVCGFVDDDTGFWCADAPPCGNLDSRGVCEDDTVVRCRFGNRVYQDCTRDGEVCRSDASGAFCAAAEEPEPEMPVDMGEPEPPVGDMGEPEPVVDMGMADMDGAKGTGSERGVRSNDDCNTAPGQGGSGVWLLLGLVAMRRRR